MIPVPFETNTKFEEVELFDKLYLFSDIRISRESLPEGTFAYDIRDSDDCEGIFCQVKDFIWVNYWGTIIGFDEIDLNLLGSREIEPDDWGFTGDYLTYEEFFQKMKGESA